MDYAYNTRSPSQRNDNGLINEAILFRMRRPTSQPPIFMKVLTHRQLIYLPKTVGESRVVYLKQLCG